MVVVVVGLLAVIALGNRPHSVVVIEDGKVRQTRGDLPGGLLGDLGDVARRLRAAKGSVEIRGEGDTVEIKVRGLDEKAAQRVRNAVMMSRRTIRRPR